MRTSPRAASVLALALALGSRPAGALDLELYARLLAQYTREVPDLAGVRVDYAGIARSPEWRQLVAGLAATDPDALAGRDARLAFWIDAYNILAIDLVVRHYPVASIRDIGSWWSPVWKRTAGSVGGRERTLDEIEHRILRPMGEPRIHAAIVCASLSCPPLRREPWRAPRLDAQLDAAMRRFLADPRKGLRIDRAARRVTLSRIFDWFAGDFAGRGGALAFVTAYLPEPERAWLRDQRDEVRVAYFDYDWRLNDLATAPAGRGDE
jgi:Protein of unknown function, DUF547